MTEREMEDLLWNHPDKLLNERFTQFKRQPSSHVGRADLIFKDRLDRLVVVEIKRGKLGRGAIEQLHDYFGMVKKEFPDEPVELMVVANSIPEERRLACEKLDIEWREISDKKFRDVAEEVGYEFESEKHLGEVVSTSASNISTPRRPNRVLSSLGGFNPASLGYCLNPNFDKAQLKRLVEQFSFAVKRSIDKSLAVHLTQELLDRDPPRIEHKTFLQIARWCNTQNPLYWDGMEVARKISILLFGKMLDRNELGT